MSCSSPKTKLFAVIGKQLFIAVFSVIFPLFAWSGTMTADHAKFEVLQQYFTTIEQVQEACVGCHNQAEAQLHDTIHWQWSYPLEGEESELNQQLGKLHVINGYHPNTVSNTSACGSCHIGFGLSSRTESVIPESSVDCLMCHDTSGEYFYKKFHQDGAECTMCHDDAGEANKKRVKKEGERFQLSLTDIAQSVGATSNQSCGSCHFYDGGADGAKHGDLDSALINAAFEMDVHMSVDGANLTCSDCHQATNHKLAGSRYQASSPTDNLGLNVLEGSRGTCQSCHDDRPMHDEKLNDHTDVVSCQACHIPVYARNGVAVKTSWDWSTAGTLDRKRRPFAKYDGDSVSYSSGKGDMVYGENLLPSYQWYNGQLDYASVGQKVDPDNTTPLNATLGQRDDPSKIFPFHVFNSTLPYDIKTEQLLPINLVGRSRNAFWNGYKWESALKQGARAGGVEFSGEFDFASVETIRALNHTVAPKEQALSCVDCHAKDGLLKDMDDLYIVGSAQHEWLDRAGFAVLLMTLLGVTGHGLLRWVFVMRRKSND